jgi:predicted Zn-dependent peptidase
MPKVPNETSRFDLYFDAGTIRGAKGVASLVNGLLLSGNKDWKSIDIQQQIDNLGGYYDSSISHEEAYISVHALKENAIPILKIIVDALRQLSFEENEVEELIRERKQKLRVNLEKVNFLAQREFQKKLFSDTDYGNVLEEKDYDAIDRQQLIDFFGTHYLKGLHKVVVIGDLKPQEIEEIISLIKPFAKDDIPLYETRFKNQPGNFKVEKQGAIQTALRVGRILFNKTHEDHLTFQVLNTILGDYFGSRLMSNIREDKGYTYGIGSMHAELYKTGYFLIATEVGKDESEAALDEIKAELKKLQEEPIDSDELELVKNYMLGQMLKSADGPYSMMDLYLNVEAYQMDFDFYNRAISTIHSITSDDIQSLAKKYLNWEEMTVISAG